MPKVAEVPGKSIPQGGYSAFLPAPLPPELHWTARLIGALSDADRLVEDWLVKVDDFPIPTF
jgi:hypothetical protein